MSTDLGVELTNRLYRCLSKNGDSVRESRLLTTNSYKERDDKA
jgi:hypothetical protein